MLDARAIERALLGAVAEAAHGLLSAPEEARTSIEAPAGAFAALRPHDAPTVAPVDPNPEAPRAALGPVGADSPYFLRVWKGHAVYGCPECPFPGTSHRAVDRHRAIVHAEPPAQDIEARAARLDIIIATH